MSADTVGGVWRYVLELARGLGERGVDPVIVTLGPRPDPAQVAEARSVARLVATDLPLDWLAPDAASLRDAAEALARIAAAERADLVHLHAPAYAGLARWPAPVVAVAHSCLATWWRAVRGTDLPDDFVWRVRATAAGLRAADRVIAPSRAFAGALRAAYGVADIAVVHNGRSEPSAKPATAREKAVLATGRLWDGGKNIPALDRAAARLDVPVYAAGAVTGPNGAEAHLPHLVLLGTLGEAALARWYASAAIYAAPARYEPFGLGVLEAAQAGMALVLSDHPTFRELWDGAASFVPAARDDLLAATITHLLADPALLRRQGALARKRARAYSVRAMVEGTLAVHRAALSDPRLASVA